MNLADRIKKIRSTFGINQEQLAEILGTSLGVPKGLEQGTTKSIKSKYSVLLAQRFKINKEWIENGKGSMLLTENESMLQDIETISQALNQNLRTIPYYENINASAGHGCINGECEPINIQLPPSLVNMSSSNIEAIRTMGDSMTGTIEDGEVIFIDKNLSLLNGKIYVVLYGDDVYVKRLFKEPSTGEIILKSDNPVYPQFVAKIEDIKIIGRVIANMSIKEL